MSLQKPQKTGRFRKRLQQAAAVQFTLLAVSLGAVIVISTGMGYIQLPPATVIKIVFAKLSGQSNLLEGLDSIRKSATQEAEQSRSRCGRGHRRRHQGDGEQG